MGELFFVRALAGHQEKERAVYALLGDADKIYFFQSKKPLRFIPNIMMFVTMNGRLFASIAKTIPDAVAAMYSINPMRFLLPKKNMPIMAQVAAT